MCYIASLHILIEITALNPTCQYKFYVNLNDNIHLESISLFVCVEAGGVF